MELRLIYLLGLIILTSCAQVRTPSGGDRDETSPVIISSSPLPFSTDFSGDRIEIEFDEYVKLENVNEQVLISPPLEERPVIELKGGKRLIVDFMGQKLRANTTYTFNYGEAIKDNNEGNPLEANVFLLSTGPYIDSLELRGTLYSAEYMDPCSGCLALLYPVLRDSMLLESRPIYVAKSNAEGKYLLSHIAPGEYRLLGLRDQDADLKIDPFELRGFLSETIIPSANDTLYHDVFMYKRVSSEGPIIRHEWSADGRSILIINDGGTLVENLSLDSGRALIYHQRTTRADSMIFWFEPPFASGDELIFQFEGTSDTLRKGIVKSIAQDLTPFAIELAHAASPMFFRTRIPMTEVNLERMRLMQDSISVPFSFTSDSFPAMELGFLAKFKEGLSYKLFLAPGAIQQAYKQSHDSLEYSIRCPKEDSFGELKLHLKLKEGEHYVIELSDKKDKVLFKMKTQKDMSWNIDHLKPGEYLIRVFLDKDHSGEWTPGDLFENKQPEPVYMIPEPLVIRANWEVEQEITPIFMQAK